MRIAHIGTAKYTSSHTNTAFILRNLLHVPHITKNLLSVSQFAKDNNVYFEFFPNDCYVKHQVTKQTLLHGTVKDGIYVFP